MRRLVRFLLSVCVVALLAPSAHAAEDVTLAWDAPGGLAPAGYRVRYRPIASSTVQERDAGRATSIRIPALVAGTTYVFHVVAYDATGRTSAPSNYLHVTIGPPAPPPLAPAPQPPPPPPPTTALTTYFPGLAGDEVSRGEPYRAFLAVGAHDPTFATRLALANPTSSPARATVYLRRDGEELSHVASVALPAFSHAEVDAQTILGSQTGTFGIGVTATVPIGVRRTTTWNAGAAGHSELASSAPAARWSFSEGATFAPFVLHYHLLNPGPALAIVSVTYLLPSGASLVRYHDLPPGARKTVVVNQEDPELASTQVTAVVESLTGQPIVAERAMFLSGRQRYRRGHVTPGATERQSHWLPSELVSGAAGGQDGRTAMATSRPEARWLVVGRPYPGAQHQADALAVANASDTWQRVRVTVLGPNGPLGAEVIEIPPRRRLDVDGVTTFWAGSGGHSLLVESVGGAGQLLIEQSTYWELDGRRWTVGTGPAAQPLPD